MDSFVVNDGSNGLGHKYMKDQKHRYEEITLIRNHKKEKKNKTKQNNVNQLDVGNKLRRVVCKSIILAIWVVHNKLIAFQNGTN